MKPYYTAQELAGLPDMPTDRSSIYRMGESGKLHRRPRQEGKGWEYAFSSLPAATQRYLLGQVAASVPAPAPETLALAVRQSPEAAEPAPTSARDRAVRDARALVLLYWDDLQKEGMGSRQAADLICSLAASGTLPAPVQAAVLAGKGRSSASVLDTSTLYRWAKCRKEGYQALAPRAKSPRAPAWGPALLALYQHPGKPSCAQAVAAWSSRYPAESAPPLRSAQRYLAGLPVQVREWGRSGPRALRAVQPFTRRSTDGLWPMDIVTVDGHAFKAYAGHPLSGQRFHPEITTYLDLATRRIVGWSAWVAESQHSIWLALRTMVLDPGCGIPAIQYSDNGAYKGMEHRALLARIGTQPMFATPYRAQARGAIERVNSSVWIPLARSLPSYSGLDADREFFSKTLKRLDKGRDLPTWEQFLDIIRQAVAGYNARPHASLSGQSPDQAWDAARAAGWSPTPLSGDDLHELLPALPDTRTVQRGEVRVPWGRYFAAELAPYHGDKVRLAYDPANGQRVWVLDLTGRLICTAERDGNASSYVPATKLEHARAQRTAAQQRRLQARADALAQTETPVLLGETLDLPDLILTPGQPDALPVERVQAAQRLIEDDLAAADPLDLLTSDGDRYAAWKSLRARQDSGERLTARQAHFLDSFGSSTFCRFMWEEEQAYYGVGA